MKTDKFDGRLTAPLAEFLSQKVAEGVERGRQPEGRRGSLPKAGLEALDLLADAGLLPTLPGKLTVVFFPEAPAAWGEVVEVASGELYARVSLAKGE